MKKKKFQHLDCTFRDGGYYNNWHFDSKLVNSYFKLISKTKVNIVELGFRFFKSKGFLGPFAFSNENFIKQLKIPNKLNIAIMLNAADIVDLSKQKLKKCFLNSRKSKINIIRIACHFNELTKIRKSIQVLKSLNYEVYINLMKISDKNSSQIIYASQLASKYKANAFYFADSFGNLKTRNIKNIINLIRKHFHGLVGIHAHNNSNLAFKNTIEAINNGVDLVDSTILGMGRGAGNVGTEELLKVYDNKGYKEIKKIINKYFLDLKQKYKWGYSKFYFQGAKSNIHPSYIQQLLSDSRYSFQDINEIIKYLKSNSLSSFNPAVIENLKIKKDKKINLSIKKWSAKNWCKNKKVLILGQGDSVKKLSSEIIDFIKKHKPITVSLNINKVLDHKYIDRFIESNEKRVLLDSNILSKYKNKLIFPVNNYQNIINYKVIKNIKFNYSFKIAKTNWKVKSNFCIIPNSLVATFGLAVIFMGNPKEIFAVGMDGKNFDEVNKNQINDFYHFLKLKFNKKIISLTKSIYNFDIDSIYKYI